MITMKARNGKVNINDLKPYENNPRRNEEQGYDFTVTNSSIALIKGLIKDKRWKMTRYGKMTPVGKTGNKKLHTSGNRMTASFIRERYETR